MLCVSIFSLCYVCVSIFGLCYVRLFAAANSAPRVLARFARAGVPGSAEKTVGVISAVGREQ